MKSKFYFLSLLLLTVYVSEIKSQVTKISFESSESYTLGGINNQNGWNVWSDGNAYPVANAQVVNTAATDGTNSVFFANNASTYDTWAGMKKDVSSITTGNDYEVSFDLFVSGTPTTDAGFFMSIFNTNSVDYNNLSNQTAGLVLYNGTMLLYNYGDGNGGVLQSTFALNTWHNFKIIVKKSTNVLQYAADGAYIYTGPLGVNKNINTMDFTFNNHGAGFRVDNLKITNLSNLAVSDVKFENEISVFPNPTSDIINVKSPSTITSAELYDLKGGLVRRFEETKPSYNIADLPKGVYLIKVKTKTTELTKKIVKN